MSENNTLDLENLDSNEPSNVEEVVEDVEPEEVAEEPEEVAAEVVVEEPSVPTTEERPSTDPKERSSPAELITKVAPIAKTPKVAVARIMLKRLLTERNTGESIAIMADSTIKTIRDSRRICKRDSKTNSSEGFVDTGQAARIKDTYFTY